MFKEALWEAGRSFFLFFLTFYIVSVLWYLVNPKQSWLYSVNARAQQFYEKVDYISFANVMLFKFFKVLIITWYAGLQPIVNLIQLPKMIERGDDTFCDRFTIIIQSLEELPLKKITSALGLHFQKNGEWYAIDHDIIYIFVIEAPPYHQVKKLTSVLNRKIKKYSGNQLHLSSPKYQQGEINVIKFKILVTRREK